MYFLAFQTYYFSIFFQLMQAYPQGYNDFW